MAEDQDLPRQVIACCEAVRSVLGPSFSEAVYHRAVEAELRGRGISYESEIPVPVTYKGLTVGHVRVDIFVAKQVVLELKATPFKVAQGHVAQAEKYMVLLGVETGLAVNMGNEAGLDYRVISGTSSR